MRQNYLQFLESKEQRKINEKSINEAFSQAQIDKVIELLDKVLAEKIQGLYPLKGFVNVESDGADCKAKQYIVKVDQGKSYTYRMFSINWLMSGESAEIYSIDFFKNIDMFWKGTSYTAVTLHTIGVSIAVLIPLIAKIITSKEMDITRDEVNKIKDAQMNESSVNIGKVKYILMENLSSQVIEDAFMIEASEADEYRCH